MNQAEGKKPLILAPGVVFKEREHTYWLDGKKLSGVTGKINEFTGSKFSGDFFEEAKAEGIHVHRAVEGWIDSDFADLNSVHPGVTWLTNTILVKLRPLATAHLYSEVLVSDLERFASAVDIVALYKDDTVDLFDTKRTFNRKKVSMQLSIYKYLIEKFTKYKVDKMWCAAFRDKEYYPVFDKGTELVEEILYSKKAVK